MTRTELFTLLKESKINFGFDVRYGERVEISLKDLTAFIDDYFLPRPLFEDGTPVKVGDRVLLYGRTDREVTDYCVCDDGSFSINYFQYDQDQRVMKPKQLEALDADGVPIELGDKLYFAEGDDTPLKCIGFDDYGNVTFTDWEQTGTIAYENLTVFTHKKPDSWEQLLKDVRVGAYSYCATLLGIDASKTLTSKNNEAFAEDVIRRAKALAGVDDE